MTVDKIKLPEPEGFLLPYPGSPPDKPAMEVVIGVVAGVHEVCNGYVNFDYVSEAYGAMSCRKCKLRILVPRTVVTWADLKTYLEGES
jgi:hypothetical protein